MHLFEVGKMVREQRMAVGLTQEQLARLSGLSRTTVNQLENGTLADLGFAKLGHLLNVLGLDLHGEPAKGLRHALVVAARTASTSYKNVLSPDLLVEMLESGYTPAEYRPHIMMLLDETPLPVVVKAIQQAAQCSSSVSSQKMMKHMAGWAAEFRSHRAVWG
jgi:transcriptional regulator with XRE-family HTH domain